MQEEAIAVPADDVSNRADARARHVALFLLIVVYTLNFIDRQILSFL